MTRYFLVLFSFLGFLSADAQYDINIELKNYNNDTLIIGNYYGDRTLVKDTLLGSNGKFHFTGTDTLDPGVYLMLLRPDNNYAQFFVNEEEKEFSISWDTKIPTGLVAEGSIDNTIFYEYLNLLESVRPRAEELKGKMAAAAEAGNQDKASEDALNVIDKQVKTKQSEIIAEHPNSITAVFIKSTINVEIPEYDGTPEDVQYKKYLYYKEHYFDNIDLGNPAVVRTPFLNDKVDTYMDKLTPNDPDSIKQAIDYLLERMEPSPQTFRFYTSYLINKYANTKIVGMDAVYVHMVDKYYSSGKAEWADEETLAKMKENANNIRPILIGRTFPAITTFMADGSPVEINKIESPYTVVLFWAHTCGHCTKSMPDVVSFFDEYESKGVTLVSVCTKGGEKTEACKEAVPGKNMEKFINTFDEYQRYRRKVYINTTPKIFILDKDKKIIIKDIPANELKNVMESVIKLDSQKG